MARRAVSKSEQEEVIKLISKHIESQKEYDELSFIDAVKELVREHKKYLRMYDWLSDMIDDIDTQLSLSNGFGKYNEGDLVANGKSK